MDAIAIEVGKRRVVKIASEHMKIIYDRGWYWKVDWELLTPHKLHQLLRTKPADDYAKILTLVEDGTFITLINFEEFDTYSIVEGFTTMEDGVYREIPEIDRTAKPMITDFIADAYNRIYGFWKVSSYLGDEEDIVEIIYNKHQELAYYIIYKKDRAIVISPISSFIIHSPTTPKIIDVSKNFAINTQGFYGFSLYHIVKTITEAFSMNFDGEIHLEPLSNSTALPEEDVPFAPFIDGEVPVYASPFGFYKGDPKYFEPRKTTRSLAPLVKPTYYRKGDFEMKLFNDLTYAVRYGEYIVLPCCLAKLNEPIELENIHSSEAAAEEVLRVGYKYATTDPAKYTTRMEFKIPNPLT